MEGRRSVVVMTMVVLLSCWVVAVAGCGDGAGSAGVATARPEIAFAPVVLLAPDEPWRPMSARWLIERSALWFAADHGCDDRKVAVGHTLPEQRVPPTDWIIQPVLGAHGGWTYYRNPYDLHCENRIHLRGYADQHVRPYDRADRPPGVGLGEGFYLDLVDSQRRGPQSLDRTAAYFARGRGGDSRVVLTYWLLFGMHAPPGRPGRTHEGDWERLDIVLDKNGDDRYTPVALRFGSINAEGAPASPRIVPWRQVDRANQTHPIVRATRASHDLRPARRGACAACELWRTWRLLAAVREEPWHGFGGAWGAIGKTGATTGPLGPHGMWAADYKE